MSSILGLERFPWRRAPHSCILAWEIPRTEEPGAVGERGSSSETGKVSWTWLKRLSRHAGSPHELLISEATANDIKGSRNDRVWELLLKSCCWNRDDLEPQLGSLTRTASLGSSENCNSGSRFGPDARTLVIVRWSHCGVERSDFANKNSDYRQHLEFFF